MGEMALTFHLLREGDEASVRQSKDFFKEEIKNPSNKLLEEVVMTIPLNSQIDLKALITVSAFGLSEISCGSKSNYIKECKSLSVMPYEEINCYLFNGKIHYSGEISSSTLPRGLFNFVNFKIDNQTSLEYFRKIKFDNLLDHSGIYKLHNIAFYLNVNRREFIRVYNEDDKKNALVCEVSPELNQGIAYEYKQWFKQMQRRQ